MNFHLGVGPAKLYFEQGKVDLETYLDRLSKFK
jgi:hypothetical protein